MRIHAVVVAATVLLGACHSLSYSAAGLPRYVSHLNDDVQQHPTHDSGALRVATFNLAFAQHVPEAVRLFETRTELRDADIVLLQEMDYAATKAFAGSLNMSFVYYPSYRHWRTHRDFGNAVLSRWPIVGDAKLILPHASRYAGTNRTATAADVQVRGRTVRVYSTHLGTFADIGSAARDDQLASILADAAPFDAVIVGGDMNSASAPRAALRQGFAWPTADGPRSTRFGRWDHLLFRGFAAVDRPATITSIGDVSDHFPVVTTATLAGMQPNVALPSN